MPRYVCIHGHFYQPPRESPWLEAIELQDGAYPFHDWNERINAECYEVNALSRILDEKDRIVEITNNYEYISFNFGPTLLSWLEVHAPLTYERIIEADRRSIERFSGHGSALAQVYNHMIMPLANDRDKATQVRWGLADFRKRFGREPEGMWLPETAVDLKTLETLADHDIRFTILAPKQAARVRRIGDQSWEDTPDERIDPTRPYRVSLPSGRTICVFFYNGPVSQALAFEHLLHSSHTFYQKLREAAGGDDGSQRLIHVATDGETYGHHHRHGDMALAAVIRRLIDQNDVKLTNYGEYLELNPPEYEVEIAENTAWSCGHGIERWRDDCGCHSGRKPDWHQEWRKPLRETFDWLRDTLAPQFEEAASTLFNDPWAARDAYASVILDRSVENVDAFFIEQAREGELHGEDRVTALRLMELQRHLMLMYTSCGWFFDDIVGIETVQVLRYAGRAVQLAEQLFGSGIEGDFLNQLEQAPGNDANYPTGRVVYEQRVRPARVDLDDVAAHYAISSLFEDDAHPAKIYCYAVDVRSHRRADSRRSTFAIGRVNIRSTITSEEADLNFGVLHFGDHNLLGYVGRANKDDDSYDEIASTIENAFHQADIAQAMRHLNDQFGEHRYTLQSLFRDQQRKILNIVLSSTLDDIESTYRRVYEDNVALLHAIGGVGVPIPDVLRTTAAFVINLDLSRAFQSCAMDMDQVQLLLNNARKWELTLDTKGLGFALQKLMERAAESLAEDPSKLDTLDCILRIARLARSLPFEVDLWQTQNTFYDLLKHHWPKQQAARESDAEQWRERFIALGEALRVRVTLDESATNAPRLSI